jgi:cobalt-zinc-cadmium efflux system membrane fusion protein
MSRTKLIRPAVVVVVLIAGAIAIALVAWALSCGSSIEDTANTDPSSRQAGDGPGQHGGVVQVQGALSVEILLSEKPGDARLIVFPFLNGKPVKPGDASLAATLVRYDGSREKLAFTVSGSKLTSSESVAKPHVFDASIELRVRGHAPTGTFAFSREDGALALSAAQIKAAGIAVARAGAAEIVTTFQLPGEIRFNEDRTAHVVPRVSGIVERVAVSIGQHVEKGQLLAVIASADLADRRSELLSAERRLSAARVAYEREKTLWQERISAEQDYLLAQVQLRENDIAVQNARQKLAAINVPASVANTALNQYELRAPFAGTIVEKHAAPGEAIAADANVFVLSDLSTIWAEMAVPAQRLDDIRVGREATVSATAFDSTASGPIAYVGALLGEQTRTAPARVVLPNPAGTWRPGMFVNVSVDAGRQGVPVAVASDALQDLDGTPVIFVQSPRGFVAQPVETGRRDSQLTEIVNGLKAGRNYAAANSFVLKAELGKGSAEE